MLIRSFFTIFIFLFSGVLFAADKTESFEVLDLKVVNLSGEQLKQAKENSLSGRGYKVQIDSEVVTVVKEDLDILIRFRGLEITEDLIGMKVGGKVETAQEALQLEILKARKKGRYTPPTQDEFTEKLAKGFLSSETNCVRAEEFIDSKTVLKYGQKISNTLKEQAAFEAAMTKKLQAIDDSATLAKIKKCPSEITTQGPEQCYEVKAKGKLVTTFYVGSNDYAGVRCLRPKGSPPPGKSKEAQRRDGDKNEP